MGDNGSNMGEVNPRQDQTTLYEPYNATEARLRVGNLTDEKQKVERGATAVRFEVELKAGDTELQTWLIESDGSSRGAYFTEVERLSGR